MNLAWELAGQMQAIQPQWMTRHQNMVQSSYPPHVRITCVDHFRQKHKYQYNGRTIIITCERKKFRKCFPT